VIRLATALAAGAVAPGLAGGTAAADPGRVIGRAVQLKGSNIWYAHGKAYRPKAISARLVSSPAQGVKVQWSVVCQKPNAADPAFHLATQGASGQASVRATGTVKLSLPYPKPSTCVATVYATLPAKGELRLELLQT
jgi:hypothetical protein